MRLMFLPRHPADDDVGAGFQVERGFRCMAGSYPVWAAHVFGPGRDITACFQGRGEIGWRFAFFQFQELQLMRFLTPILQAHRRLTGRQLVRAIKSVLGGGERHHPRTGRSGGYRRNPGYRGCQTGAYRYT